MIRLFPKPVIELTDKNFERIIDNRQNSSVFFVMFHGEQCPACRASYPGFISASKKLEGMITFCHIDISRNPKLSQRFRITSIPTFLIFHSKGISTHFSFFRSESTFIKACTSYIPNYCETPNISWLNDERNSVILFSNRNQPPIYWLSISNNFQNEHLRIGYTHNKTIFKEFQILNKEQIILIKDKETQYYKGPMDYLNISTYIKENIKDNEIIKEL